MTLLFRDPQPGDAQRLYIRMRREDRNELIARFGKARALRALCAGMQNRGACAVAISPSGSIEAAFGCEFGDLDDTPMGIPWLLGTDMIIEDTRFLMRQSRMAVNSWLSRVPRLGNWVDARNRTHIRYMLHLGFKPRRTEAKFGYERRPFVLMVKENVHS
jgi:hypothetical protein